MPEPGYLPGLEQACREFGALFMVDEVQTGLGRTGQWFSFQNEQLTPDVVTMAKALGNGVPVGACWAAEEIADAFVPGDHGTTYGGQPLAMSAARATLRTMINIDAPALAQAAGAKLRNQLIDLPGVVDVRGRGLLLGIALSDAIAGAVVAACLNQGLILNAVRPDTIRMTPPLTVSDEDIARAVEILAAVLTEEMQP